MTDAIAGNWPLFTYLLLGLVLAVGFAWYERTRPPARIVALVAAMTALAVVGRLAFAAIPNVKPTTDIVLFAGYALGGVPGFAVGALTALVSNVFFGQGPWTVWQMVAWGGAGVAGAGLARVMRGREPSRFTLAVACAVAGAGFGAFMDVYQWSFAAEQTSGSYLAVSATSLPYNAAHVIGNVVFALLLGPTFVRALGRYKRRFQVRWTRTAPQPAVLGAVALALAVGAGGLHAPAAQAASPAAKAARYLQKAQNRDGGFGGTRGAGSSQLFTGWAALGLASAGKNPQDVKRGSSVIAYVGRGGGGDVGTLERTILVVKASGMSPTGFRGRNLVSTLTGKRRGDGSWGDNVAFTAFGVLAQRAGGLSTGYVSRSASWLGRAQNGDGGFGYVPSASSDVDDTGAALQALRAAGRGGAPVRRAVAYLRSAQNGDGGFGQSKGRSSNAQSTAWAVQGLVAAGVRPDGVGANPIRYLTRLQRADGHIRYSATSEQTPVWVTAQALTALTRKAFPLGAAPRAKKRKATRPAAAPAAAKAAKAKAKKKRREKHAAPKPDASQAATPATTTPRPEAKQSERASARTDGERGRDGGTVPVWLIGCAVAAALALLWVFRRRLLPLAFR